LYYIVFFVDPSECLIRKINRGDFLLSNPWIYVDQQEKLLQSIDDITLSSEYLYLLSWCIHGELMGTDFNGVVQIPICASCVYKTCLKEIDAFLNRIAKRYEWTIFPWGGPKAFASFGFISREISLYKQFLKSINEMEGISPMKSISEYMVSDDISKKINAIVFKGSILSLSILWDVCDCDAFAPWVITDILFDGESDGERFSLYDLETPYYTVIDTVYINGDLDRPRWIYQPQCKIDFISMCRVRNYESEIFIVVPQFTDLNGIQELLNDIDDYGNYSDLIHLNSITSRGRWLYAIDRDQSDYGISLFTALNSRLLKHFDEINQSSNEDYRLISCF
jgi:hypothetical protein